jgi:hypothetical protein
MADCECHVILIGEGVDADVEYAEQYWPIEDIFRYCPLHAAAEQLLNALLVLTLGMENGARDVHLLIPAWKVELALSAIAAARKETP